MRRDTFSLDWATEHATTDTLNMVGTSVDLLALEHFSVFALNAAGGAALDACTLEASGDNTNWATIDNTTLASLAAGAVDQIDVTNNGRRYYRLRASTAANTATLTVVVTGNG